jgi:hypothetical protein
MSYNSCLAVVKNNGLVLEYVPVEHRNRDICLIAVTRDRNALKYVPKKQRSEFAV